MLAAGLEGIEKKYELPDPVEKDVYHLSKAEREALGIQSLPGSLGEALDLAKRSELVRRTLGDHIFEQFIKSKEIEWDRYRVVVHPWEIKEYLPIL
jgi:glutamine synthetase